MKHYRGRIDMKSKISENSKIEYLSKLLNRVFCVLTLFEEKEKERGYKKKKKEINLIKHAKRLYNEFEDSSWLLEPLFGGEYIEMLNKVRRLRKLSFNSQAFMHREIRSLVLDTTNMISRKIDSMKKSDSIKDERG